MTTSPYPYLIFYEVTHEEIVIHAVRHGARDPSGMPGTEWRCLFPPPNVGLPAGGGSR
jgi:hypothetical protein